MKFLVLAPQNVIPPSDGGKASIYHPLRAFATAHDVHFAFPTPSGGPSEAKLCSHYAEIGITPLPLPPIHPEGPLQILGNVARALPFKFKKYNYPRNLAVLRAYLTEHNIRVIWVNHLHMMPTALALREATGCKVILREHNIESDLVAQYAALHPSPFHRLIAQWQWRKTLAYEKRAWMEADATLFISDSDAELARHLSGLEPKEAPLYDIAPLSDQAPQTEGPALSFVYPLRASSFQNAYSAKRFLESVWRPFVRRNPQAVLRVTGSTIEEFHNLTSLPPSEQALLRIEPLGMVDDYLGLIRSHRYFVSPTYIGSGIRVKLIEAMGQGCLCLCSELDLKSIHAFEDGENLAAFQSVGDFESAVHRLEGSPELRSDLRRNAWKLATQLFSSDTYLERATAVLSAYAKEPE